MKEIEIYHRSLWDVIDMNPIAQKLQDAAVDFDTAEDYPAIRVSDDNYAHAVYLINSLGYETSGDPK
jgi:hypothetical protein